jgi:hypothetical protein
MYPNERVQVLLLGYHVDVRILDLDVVVGGSNAHSTGVEEGEAITKESADHCNI